jgi:periplasmic protein TonB
MALRCLLFSSDEGTAEPVRQALAGLGVEGEYCSAAVAAVEKVTHQNFQIVIIDWDMQPEAGVLLTTARERKAAERPLTLAIVSDDVSVPKALQAGANSILRKPLLVNQVKDTLTTARDLLRAKQESATAAAAGASAGSASSAPQVDETSQPAKNFLESSPSVPIGQFVAKSHAPEFVTALEPIVSPESEPVPVPVTEEKFSPSPAAPASPPPPDGPKGLEWYLKTRLGNTTTRQAVEQAPSPSADNDLLGYAQMTATASKAAPSKSSDAAAAYASERKRDHKDIRESTTEERKNDERKKEAELFAYMAGEKGSSEEVSRPTSRLKGAIVGALVLAGCAILAAPQAPWHSNMRGVWTRGRQAMHGWLNPQPVTPVQAPVAHENFGRAGDEYKLPVEENIPDATTDPSQIQVVPVIDPTAKKLNNDATTPVPPAGPPDATGATPSDQTSAPAVQIPDKQPSPSTPDSGKPATGGGAPVSLVLPPLVTPPHSDSTVPAPITSSAPSFPAQRAPAQKPPHEPSSSGHVPSSLKSQISSMTPEASGNKLPEAAMNSIEPVVVTEAVERALLTEQPALAYPANAGGQHGTVILQVLIGRDGTVQDAKFLQGSLAFARVAIDGVRQWKFKPYSMNGRAVSVQTQLTISFKPGQ